MKAMLIGAADRWLGVRAQAYLRLELRVPHQWCAPFPQSDKQQEKHRFPTKHQHTGRHIADDFTFVGAMDS